MSGYQGKCAKEEENELKMENLGINCSIENDEKQCIERNVLVNSPQDKLMGEVLGETAKFEQVLQETDKSIHLYLSVFEGKKYKQKNVYTEITKTPVTFFFDEIAKKRNKMFEKKKQKAWRIEPCFLHRKNEEMKPKKRLSVRSNSHPLEIKIEEEEAKEEEEEKKDADVYNGYFCKRICTNCDKSLSLRVPVSHPYIHPPVLPPPPPPPPPPDLLDDFNPDFQQPHVNFNPPDFENNVFHPIIINPLPPHHNNPAPPPPDYLE